MRIFLTQVVAVISGHHRQAKVLFQLEESRADAVLHRQTLILNLKVEVILSENVAECAGGVARGIVVSFHQALRNFAFQASRKPDEAARMLRQELLAHPGLVVKAVQRSLRRNLH